jgi:hypothetical protein
MIVFAFPGMLSECATINIDTMGLNKGTIVGM